MADRKDEETRGIVNYGGTNTFNGCAVGEGATIVNGEVVQGQKIDDKTKDKKRKGGR